ncbi:MAG TPA: CRISPR-associated endonuclease Cas2 [Desulfitobacteriaceae bacterium]|nr:CRISPR-associated endonuclease Cas2 [Desulfitobacteriaceae bacterium]
MAKVLKRSRKYLYWVQNSVFEGEISEANYKKLKMELAQIINEDEDSIIYYTFRTTKYSSVKQWALKKRR